MTSTERCTHTQSFPTLLVFIKLYQWLRCLYTASTQAIAHMGPLWQALFFFLLHRVAACATTENTGIGCVCWQVAALLLHPSLSPTALWVKSFHISTETLLIAHSQFPGKSNNVSSISLTEIKRIHVAAVTWLVLHTTLVTGSTY